MNTVYTDKIRDITLDTFEVTCCMFPLEDWEVQEGEYGDSEAGIKSIVRFDGVTNGALVITPSAVLLDAIAANMLGVDAAESKQKEDALCEIANIICGNTVPLFAENHKICYIQPPKIIRSDECFSREYANMQHESFKMILNEGTVVVDIYYRKTKEAKR